MGNTCKYQDWRDLGPVATNFSQDIAATLASNIQHAGIPCDNPIPVIF
jgi:hypothetical protein